MTIFSSYLSHFQRVDELRFRPRVDHGNCRMAMTAARASVARLPLLGSGDEVGTVTFQGPFLELVLVISLR